MNAAYLEAYARNLEAMNKLIFEISESYCSPWESPGDSSRGNASTPSEECAYCKSIIAPQKNQCDSCGAPKLKSRPNTFL